MNTARPRIPSPRTAGILDESSQVSKHEVNFQSKKPNTHTHKDSFVTLIVVEVNEDETRLI